MRPKNVDNKIDDDKSSTYSSAPLLPRLQVHRRQQDRAWKQPSPGENMIVLPRMCDHDSLIQFIDCNLESLFRMEFNCKPIGGW